MSIKLAIPQRESIELQHAVFDINGTLAIDGVAIPGVSERLKTLSEQLSIHLISSGTHGNLKELEQALGFPIQNIVKGDEKMRYVQQLGASKVIAFGNGVNDNGMLRLAVIGIAVLDSEGTAMRAIQAADVFVNGPINAIDLLLKPKRLIATLRD
ncbi:HAD family hydrolase [Tengunoibacter tsumagoiensis]|uniref:ATPase P n=1 Tax=Tengunoibacter tsumagoiensis TaxID=2014871 RepID=A0A401ZXR5_9CHLR|nr:HAD hydrolase family protein [Tengunoibacter tsumagoiensis]GCE11644.1 hypothetical protein KTT_15030 [Tengunoibacter tsumagoiensis]